VKLWQHFLAVAIVVASAASTANAQVALALTLTDQSPRHRDVAAGIVSRLADQWAFVHPPLAADEIALCRGERACTIKLAAARGASHLLMLGVAGLGPRDVVVTAQVIAVTAAGDGADVADVNAVVVGSANAATDGHDVADTLVAAVGGVPAAQPRPERAIGVVDDVPWDVVGVVIVAAGVVVGGASFGLAVANAGDPNRRDLALFGAVGGGALGVATASVGAGILVADTLSTVPASP